MTTQTAKECPPHVRERIDRAVAFINDHFREAPDLRTIAAAAYYSPFHFQRVFYDAMGESPKHMVDRLRVEEAKRLLTTTRLSMGEIAEQLGFESHGHFTAVFSRACESSPRDYRRSHPMLCPCCGHSFDEPAPTPTTTPAGEKP